MALPTSTGGSLAFRWGPSSHEDNAAQRIYYEGFSLSGVQYTVGTDCVFLLPEEPGQENYVGRLVAAFARMGGCGTDAYSIEVRWFERLQNRELVELEETDVNPTGCLAGVATVLMADSREQAERMAAAQDIPDNWFYCRGIFKQLTNEFVPYSSLSPPVAPSSSGKRRAEDSADSGDARPAVQKHAGRPFKRQNKGRRQPSPDSGSGHAVAQVVEPAVLPSSKCQRGKGPGQQCIECGATQTPQWREGPAGPKTLCNACGVRYNRLRANRRGGSFKQFHGRNKGPKATVREPVRSMTTAFSEQAQEADQLQEDAAPLLDHRRQQQRRNSGSAGVNTNGRPVRQAALASASRTAAIARLGVLAEDDDDAESDKCEEEDDEEEEEEEHGQACARVSIAKGRSAVVTVVTTAPDAPTMAAVAATSGRDDRAVQECSLDSSRSAQGRLQAPTPTPTPAPVLHELQALHSAGSSVGLPDLLCEELQAGGNDCTFEHGPSSPNSTCGPDGPTFLPPCLVAIKPETSTDVGTLLQHDTYLTAEPTLPGACPAAAANVLRRVALRAVGFCPDAAEFGEVFSSLEALQSTLPEDAMQQLVSMAEQVDAVAGEAAAAEAALQAVAQVLAARQKAADASRERAVSAVEKLKYCMSDLVQQHSHDTPGSEVATHAAALALAAEVLPSHEFGHMLLGLSMDSKLGMVPVSWGQHSLVDHEPQQLLEMEGSPMLGLGMLDSGAELLCLDGSFGSAV